MSKRNLSIHLTFLVCTNDLLISKKCKRNNQKAIFTASFLHTHLDVHFWEAFVFPVYMKLNVSSRILSIKHTAPFVSFSYFLTCQNLFQIFSVYGTVEKMIIFTKQGQPQALIQYSRGLEAYMAKAVSAIRFLKPFWLLFQAWILSGSVPNFLNSSVTWQIFSLY